MADHEVSAVKREAGGRPESSARTINAHLLHEVDLLRQKNGELLRQLAEARIDSQAALNARRATLNLMEDILEARRAEDRESAERRRAEAELRASEEKYRSLFESIDEGVFIIERLDRASDGPLEFRFLEANPAFAEQSGVEDVVGKTLRGAFPDDSEEWHRTLEHVASAGEPIRDELQLASKGRVLEFYAFRMGGTAAVRVAVIFKDVTERKAAEQTLRESDRRKDEFLATLAHELRNPLAPISNSLQILRLCFSEDATVDEVCGIMERQLNHMVRLVDDLLEISRINRGSIELRQEPTQLGSVIRTALELSRPLIESMGHELDVSIPSTPITVIGDPVRLGQVFSNLLNNAAKYTDQGGQIWLAVRQDGDRAITTVKDTGIGIPEALISSVFDMFTQIDRNAGRSGGGLGIGLTLARRLVEMHGGRITGRSEGPGRGSEFTVTLPVSSDAELRPQEAMDNRTQARLRNRRVLVVDDNADSADTLGRLLKVLGTDVQIANDGAAALELVDRFHPEVVFLDLGMPGMDGLEVARRIRERSPSEHLMLVALTGWGQVSDRTRTRDAGFDHHLVKPASMTALRALLS